MLLDLEGPSARGHLSPAVTTQVPGYLGQRTRPEQGLAVVILGGILRSSVLSRNPLPALYLRCQRP